MHGGDGRPYVAPIGPVKRFFFENQTAKELSLKLEKELYGPDRGQLQPVGPGETFLAKSTFGEFGS